jgi:2-amino-4-hydroxy-6-hydroxymethyldihydropteridine diphosphokinase/dihydropteroate synthase
MKSLYRVTVAKGGAFASRNVFLSRNSNVATKVSTMASIRHNSSTPERVKATPWTPHSLKGSTLTHNSPSSLAKASKNGTTKRTAYIALGSNLGDRIEWIEKACNEMSARGIKVKRTSSLWETQPMYVVDQANFVNGACEVSL